MEKDYNALSLVIGVNLDYFMGRLLFFPQTRLSTSIVQCIYIQYINVCGLISASIEQSGNKYYMYMNNSGAHDIVGLACDSLVTSRP